MCNKHQCYKNYKNYIQYVEWKTDELFFLDRGSVPIILFLFYHYSRTNPSQNKWPQIKWQKRILKSFQIWNP